VRFAAAAAVALLAGLLPGSNSAASGPDGTLTLSYECGFLSGAQRVAVGLTQDYPATGTTGVPIQPGRVTATVTVPRAALAALLPADAATVSGSAALTARISEGTSRADAPWPGLTAPAAPTTGDLVLTFGGPVPAVTVTAPGEVRFAAGELALTLSPQSAPATPAPGTPTPTDTPTTTAPGTPTPTDAVTATDSPTVGDTTADATAAPQITIAPRSALAAVTGRCTPEAGQQTLLGSVPVTDDSASPGASTGATPSGSAHAHGPLSPGAKATTPGQPGHGTIEVAPDLHSGVHDCGEPPEGQPDPDIIARQKRPPGVTVYPGPGDPPLPPYSQCGFTTGYANIGKLHGASTVNDLRHHPQMVNVVQKGLAFDFSSSDPLDFYLEIDSIAQMQLPPTEATFLTYGFMPTTATMTIVPRGLMTVISLGSGVPGTLGVSTIYGKQDLRLSDVKINGTPLDVGPDCRTAAPLDIELVGYDRSTLTGSPTGPRDYGVVIGGPLAQDHLYIPPFTGCGSHGEDLDALFTAAVSGPGNSLNLIQGPLCIPIAQLGCDPEIGFPDPPHH
jgi:hypothetical protein